ncbi:transcriptional regulator, GntR family [Caldicellulosiruptor kronotskyensis 2002]|uniref:Transcriptional regulator, GntR family n=1 Tax=Caldicellulosiruptor kronotskyensis (strain DSM 18902 / VKM B-2412 / 2002) TaxID=632348 RepID=E4SD47_CALK2|nr:GntR family transcriptional regulator [Caldicellulosiruptor kronotskyensis]ADQ45111.1 transcriptional regulator, GntR family [Caldicellulosiruptor kronotskyensis 2002]
MVEFNPNVPIYLQVLEYLKKQIVSGKIRPGEKLPSVREMAQRFNINPNTAQRVFQELEREGLAKTERGIGNFVTSDTKLIQDLKEKMAEKIIEDFILAMKEIGYDKEEILNLLNKKLNGEE